LHGLLLDLNNGEFKLLVVRDDRGLVTVGVDVTVDRAEESEAERDMIDAGNDNTDTLDALSDADCKDESSSLNGSLYLPLFSGVTNLVGIDFRLWIPFEDRVAIVLCTLFNEGSMAKELLGRMEILAVVVFVLSVVD